MAEQLANSQPSMRRIDPAEFDLSADAVVWEAPALDLDNLLGPEATAARLQQAKRIEERRRRGIDGLIESAFKDLM